MFRNQACQCAKLYNYFTSLGNVSANPCPASFDETQKFCQYVTVSPLHGSLIHNSFNIPDLYLAIVSYNPKSARDTFFQIINVLWIYFTFFIIHMIISAVSTSKRIDIFTRDITNPIKQVCYKMERIIEYVHNKTVLKNIQVDDIIIREETEIKQLAKHFSTTYKNQQSLGIFS